jgi:hypothetical protein
MLSIKKWSLQIVECPIVEMQFYFNARTSGAHSGRGDFSRWGGFAIAAVYRFGPSREQPQWRWIHPEAFSPPRPGLRLTAEKHRLKVMFAAADNNRLSRRELMNWAAAARERA